MLLGVLDTASRRERPQLTQNTTLSPQHFAKSRHKNKLGSSEQNQSTKAGDPSVSIGSRINSLAEGVRFHFCTRISSSSCRKKSCVSNTDSDSSPEPGSSSKACQEVPAELLGFQKKPSGPSLLSSLKAPARQAERNLAPSSWTHCRRGSGLQGLLTHSAHPVEVLSSPL